MSVPPPRLAGPDAGAHPALLSRRFHDLTLAAVTGLIALGLALAITLAVPHPNVARVAAIIVGGLVVFVLLVSPRYTVTVTILVVYLGLLDGPVKLLTASQSASSVRNILTLAIALGMLVRLSVGKGPLKLPPLAGWVLAFVAIVLMQALNPATHGILKVIGGFRQELQWIPFFFFGYLLMRSKVRFRQMFLILGVIALANGAVSAYQARISPTALASWGPGYGSKVKGTKGARGGAGLAGRTYSVEGEARNRPPGLASDSGGGGGLGVLALPGLLALLSVGRLRRRWIALLCLAGALAGIASAGARQPVLTAVTVLVSYVVLSLISRLKITRVFAALMVMIALTVGVGAYLEAENGPNIFKRQESITSVSSAEETGGKQKLIHLEALPRDITGAPLGSGLGTGGAAGGFGGSQRVEIEGRGASAEGTLNLLVLELGAPGLFLWIGLTINVLMLAVLRIRGVEDRELRTYLVAAFAAYMGHIVSGFGGPTIGTVGGAYAWFAAGIAAYWLAGPGRAVVRPRSFADKPRPLVATASA
jgi:hypothetical protein